MSVFPISNNEVHIPMLASGCCSKEFFTNYPTQLRGYIQPDEFAESIGNINKTIRSERSIALCNFAFVLVIFAGLALILVGAIVNFDSKPYAFPIFIGVGSGVLGIGLLCVLIAFIILQVRSRIRMNEALEIESSKYSMKSVPCTWRYHISRDWERRRGAIRLVTTEEVIIKIEKKDPSSNTVNVSPTDICFHCKSKKVDLTAKFCSQCGQSFIN